METEPVITKLKRGRTQEMFCTECGATVETVTLDGATVETLRSIALAEKLNDYDSVVQFLLGMYARVKILKGGE
jgi:hypothetical protein